MYNCFNTDLTHIKKELSMKRLLQLRSERGLTQEALGNIVGTSQDTISDWERGKSFPRVLQLVKLVEYFNVTIDYLLSPPDETA
jgi:transcriptional regulator with XRE-family HTH domain